MSPNSSHAFDRPLRVELRHSRLLLAAFAGGYGVAMLACCTLPWPVGWRILMLALLFLQCLDSCRRHAVATCPGAIRALDWNRERGWSVRDAAGRWEQVVLCPPVLVTAGLTMARFRGVRRRALILVADRLSAGEFRRLRVRLIQSAHGDGDRKKIPGAR